MNRIFQQNEPSVRSFQDKDVVVDRLFLVKDKILGVGKNGRSFLSLLVGDKTGHIDARIWDQVETLNESFSINDIVCIKGLIQIYNNKKQLVIHRLEKMEETQFNKSDFLVEGQKIDAHALYSELIQIIQSIESTYIQQLCLDVLQDENLKKTLLQSPAAKTIHHAERGGLLSHIISICHMMTAVSKNYEYLNRDLLIFGAIFHDLGKVFELEINKNDQISYTTKGQFLGHMLIGCEIVETRASRILGFPEDLKMILKHIILSHHGKMEYGSPKVPLIAEAFVVAAIDDFDSKMNQIHRIITDEGQAPDSWSRYSEHFDRYFYTENLKGKWI